jgi:hypothetical protein
MAQRIQIEYINKSDKLNPSERISHVGGTNNCRPWRMTEARAIEYIENGTYLFYIIKEYVKIDVIIAESSSHHKYLKSYSDGLSPDNMLKLKECPENSY